MLDTDFSFHLGRYISDLVAAALAWLSQEGQLQNQSARQVRFR